MILNCPSCSAKFMISSEALGADGREVRCGKCGHMWFQQGERDSLDDLPLHEGEHEVPQFGQRKVDVDLDFTPHHEAAPAESIKSKPAAEKVVEHPDIQVDLKDRKPLLPRQQQKQVAAVLVALAITSTLFLGFISFRNSVGLNVPFLGAAYNKMGFSVKTEKPKIAFDRIKLSFDGADVSGAGSLINLTSDALPVKAITADLLDEKNKVLQSADIKIKDDSLDGESTQKINFTFKDAPKEASSVRLHIDN